jgi:hypothetical protein
MNTIGSRDDIFFWNNLDAQAHVFRLILNIIYSHLVETEVGLELEQYFVL